MSLTQFGWALLYLKTQPGLIRRVIIHCPRGGTLGRYVSPLLTVSQPLQESIFPWLLPKSWGLWRSLRKCKGPFGGMTFCLDVSFLIISELLQLHQSFEVFNSAVFSLSMNWQFKKYFVNPKERDKSHFTLSPYMLISDIQATWILICFFNSVSPHYAFLLRHNDC